MEKKRNQKHHDKHQKHHQPQDAYEIYEAEHMAWWLKDIHPRPSARLNSNQFEEITPKAGNRIVVDNWRTTEDSIEGKRVIFDEDIDAEAAEFIELEHEKFGLSKWMSKKGY
ncbi:unnamed protein product [Fraxinus pennsylvanica]|uniref:Uncharacterized protein n=1 Tax=Fraxinus pennsylvanica TaxID=56036 RepID=A0AAD1YUR3_9LAMI|nr:unnamed protein product [Fraxinus pennsylvanica]